MTTEERGQAAATQAWTSDPGAPPLGGVVALLALLLVAWCGVHMTGAVNERVDAAVWRIAGAGADPR